MIALKIILSLPLIARVTGLDNGLARKPPMGFNTWERYRCLVDCENYPDECISEKLIKRTADIMSREYLKAGYEYLVVDDCWLADTRDSDGNLRPNAERFPSGMTSLVDYVHSKGLKFGIYGNFGERTCAGYPGIKYELKKDAELFASWKVDFVKLDGCFSEVHEKALGYPDFGRYLNQTGRRIMYSCSWPAYLEDVAIEPNYTKLVQTCNLWRNYDDIEDSWKSFELIIDYFGRNVEVLRQFHGPGHWNDPDMLIIGNYGLSVDQAFAQMAIWCVLAAPLFMSADLSRMKPEFKAILTNPDAIRINQDPMGVMGRRVSSMKGIQIWRKPIEPVSKGYPSFAIVILNMRINGHPSFVSRTTEGLGLYHPSGYTVTDVFKNVTKIIRPGQQISMRVNPTGCVFLKFTIITGEDKSDETFRCSRSLGSADASCILNF